MAKKTSGHRRAGLVSVITSPLGFFVLSLLIVETTIAVVLVQSDLLPQDKFYGLLLAVGMFVLVVVVVTLLVWFKAEKLTFDRDAHLIDRGKIPYGSETDQLKASDLEKLSRKPAPKDEATP